MTPVIRLLASVPSVVYGLIGVLVLVPFVGNDLITTGQKESVVNVIQLTGAGLLAVASLILTRDGHADHDGADHRRARLGAALVARGRGRARPQPAARDDRRLAARDPPGDHRRRPRSRRRARSARRS